MSTNNCYSCEIPAVALVFAAFALSLQPCKTAKFSLSLSPPRDRLFHFGFRYVARQPGVENFLYLKWSASFMAVHLTWRHKCNFSWIGGTLPLRRWLQLHPLTLSFIRQKCKWIRGNYRYLAFLPLLLVISITTRSLISLAPSRGG